MTLTGRILSLSLVRTLASGNIWIYRIGRISWKRFVSLVFARSLCFVA